MTQYDKQRIENALWTLRQYSVELQSTKAAITVEGVHINTFNALRVLDLALYKLSD